LFFIYFLGINIVNSQNIKIPEFTPEQKDNANTIKLFDSQIVEYKSYNKVNVTTKYRVLFIMKLDLMV